MSDSSEWSRRRLSLVGRRRREVRVVLDPGQQALGPQLATPPVPRPGLADHLSNLGDAIARNRWIALAVFAAVFVPALLWILLSPPLYEAEVRILVQRPRAEAVDAQTGPVSPQEVRSEIELLRSHELLAHAVQGQGLVAADAGEAELERVVRRIEQNLRVEALSDSNIIAMRYAAQEPKQAAGLLNGLAAAYLEKRAAIEGNAEALQFFQEQVGFHGNELEHAQQAVSEFSGANQISLLEEQKGAALRRIEELEIELAAVGAEIQAGQRRMAHLRRQGEQLPQTVQIESRTARNQALIEKLKILLVDLETQRTELLARYQPGYRLVAEVEKKITDAQAALRREEQAVVVDQTEALNPIRQSMEAEYFRTQTELAGLEARHGELRRKLSEQRERQMRLEALTAEHDTLRRNLKLAEENYLRYEERKEQSRIANALDLEQLLHVSIVEPAREPALPDKRYDAMALLVGLLLASCSGVGAAVARDRQHRAVTSAAELAMLTGLPVLTTAPETKKR